MQKPLTSWRSSHPIQVRVTAPDAPAIPRSTYMPTYGVPRYDRRMGRSAHRSDGDVLPAEVTSFVGRRHELGEARKLLSTSRLVTLTGPGGVGKTRMAMRIADQARR